MGGRTLSVDVDAGRAPMIEQGRDCGPGWRNRGEGTPGLTKRDDRKDMEFTIFACAGIGLRNGDNLSRASVVPPAFFFFFLWNAGGRSLGASFKEAERLRKADQR